MTAFESFYMFVLCPCVCMDVAFSLYWYKRIPLESSAVHKLYDTTRRVFQAFFIFIFILRWKTQIQRHHFLRKDGLGGGGGAVCSVLGMLKPKPRYALSELSVLPLFVVFVCLASFFLKLVGVVWYLSNNVTWQYSHRVFLWDFNDQRYVSGDIAKEIILKRYAL